MNNGKEGTEEKGKERKEKGGMSKSLKPPTSPFFF